MECYNQAVVDSTEKINSVSDKNENTCSVLQNIENFFVFDEKIFLVDTSKNLWRLKKCSKYEKFTNENNYSNKEENLMAYLEYYQNEKKIKHENNNESDVTDRDKDKGEKQGDTSFVLSD